MSWQDHGKCLTLDPSLWDGVPVNGNWNSPLDFTVAKAVCDTCPVSRICGETAIQDRDIHSMRGGLTPRQLARRELGRLS